MSAIELASVDGAITPTPEARIPPGDDGLLRGDGVFEVIRLYEGHPFAVAEHLDRLERSAAAIELDVPRAELETEIAALLERFGADDGQLRLVVTRGGRRLAFTENFPEHAQSVSLAPVEYNPTIILTGVKSLSYGANMQATRLAKAKGGDEALLVRPDGIVLEAPTSTIFWASDGALRTPSIEAGILASITRERLLGELDVAEGEYPLDDLLAADEAFLASTVREVQPISAVGDRDLPSVPGPLTEAAGAAFKSVIERELPAAKAEVEA
ncbi:aminodeoxychorismate lyase [soil metagenome]